MCALYDTFGLIYQSQQKSSFDSSGILTVFAVKVAPSYKKITCYKTISILRVIKCEQLS